MVSLDIASNDSFYMVVWAWSGTIYGQRFQPDGTPIDPAPVSLYNDTVSQVSIGALGNNFYLAYTYVVSINQRYIKGVRINGETMSIMGSPVSVYDGWTTYARRPVVRSFSDRWLVVWEAQMTHDQQYSTIKGFFVTPDGQMGSPFSINTSGDADHPAVAIGNSRAFIVWEDYENWPPEGIIYARMLNQNGTFVDDPFQVNNANNRQTSPAAAWDGSQFTTAWRDYRSLTGFYEQLRGDIYASRISFDGVVLDPDGIQLTSGPLPEEYVAAAAANGKTLFTFSKMNGGFYPEVQRIGYRILETLTASPVTITLTPLNPPIIIPASGGNINFDVLVENVSSVPQNFDAWIDISYEGGTPITVVQRAFSNYLPGWTINRPNAFFPVPGSYDAGYYTLTGRVGSHPDEIWDESGFPFTKEGVTDGLTFVPWTPDGLEDPFSVNSITGKAAPTHFLLSGAYPNPFNPVTTIRYAVPNATRITLSVHDLQGRQVADLVNGQRDAGIHEVTFDASELTSGIYFYRLNSENYTTVGKLMLVK